MKRLRWKGRYQSGNQQQDQENKQLTQCVNAFVEASRSHEHCGGMEDLLVQMVDSTEQLLTQQRPRHEIEAELRQAIESQTPLPAYRSSACRRCGVCELTSHAPAAHLTPASNCLNLQERR